jgi:hypothetical protein
MPPAAVQPAPAFAPMQYVVKRRTESIELQQRIYIIIWLRLFLLFVHSLFPTKPAGLDPPIFYMRNILGIKVI